VRNWSNTRRGADYPLLGAKRFRAEKERSRSSQEAVDFHPGPAVTARSYWLTNPLFARRDAVSTSREDVPESGNAELSFNASSQTEFFVGEHYFFRIGYEGTWMVLRKLKGLVYLQHLLLHPLEKVDAPHLDALGKERSGSRDAEARIERRYNPHEGSLGDPHFGDILDPHAKREYRTRLGELRAELDEATSWSDLERADSIRREIDVLRTQLAQAFDRKGRARKMSDPMERARKAVTNRIHDAIQRIGKQHPDLGRHLENAIHTGYFCWYSPERSVTWSSELPQPLRNPSSD
jgi:hypothetical protein